MTVHSMRNPLLAKCPILTRSSLLEDLQQRWKELELLSKKEPSNVFTRLLMPAGDLLSTLHDGADS